ncbi:MAG TPA: zf-HC2 domain-containing protein [Vicinamibacteria bacterium]|nr:zf-HC2 domain-containing protein [Vicinamibacteria bacterium]
MKDALDCGRAEELFSDHLDGALADPLRADLERHLASCGRCGELWGAVGEVVSALRSAPELEPARDLAQRAASAALRAAEPSPRLLASARLFHVPRIAAATQELFASSVPALVRGLAAALALAITGGVLLAQSYAAPPVRAANRVVERTVNAGAYLAERKDRLVEDFRLLRVVIGTAFEGRLDRVNDRVDDYRRLLERRRALQAPQSPPPDARAPSVPGGAGRRDASRSAAPDRQFVNFRLAAGVTPCVTREAPWRIGRPMTRSCARRTA